MAARRIQSLLSTIKRNEPEPSAPNAAGVNAVWLLHELPDLQPESRSSLGVAYLGALFQATRTPSVDTCVQRASMGLMTAAVAFAHGGR